MTHHARVNLDLSGVEVDLQLQNEVPNWQSSAYDRDTLNNPVRLQNADSTLSYSQLPPLQLTNDRSSARDTDQPSKQGSGKHTGHHERNHYDVGNGYDGVVQYNSGDHISDSTASSGDHRDGSMSRIEYKNGRSALISQENGIVAKLVSADRVTYEKVDDPSLADRKSLIARLGKDPGPEYQFYRIEGGSQRNSAGHNNDLVIARINRDANNNVKVETLYPVKQTMEYLANGDTINTYPGGARTVTRTMADGRMFVKTDYPNSEGRSRLNIYTPGAKHPRTFDVDEKQKTMTETTKKYYVGS